MFQSTHPHGVRPNLPVIIILKCGFNPRTHTGCDVLRLLDLTKYKSFNPRTHTGCDMVLFKEAEILTLFQSTHPHGVRLTMISTALASGSFNPRTHTGCDLCISEALNVHFCFNPRTHTGCDGIVCTVITILTMFQSTHPHGVRLRLH